MTPAARPAKRRNETRELVVPIMAAVNACHGVSVWRPHVLSGAARDLAGAGLAVGSADLVGLVDCYVTETDHFGRFFSLEVKWPGKQPSADQRLWGEIVHRRNGFWCVVHSVSEALEAVDRCRAGQSE
jgi:hypothetical protein